MSEVKTDVRNEDEKPAPLWLKRVPLITGVLAAIAGFLTVKGAVFSNEAIYHSNQGVLFQAQASDKWSEYQANSIKARIVETTLVAGVTDPGARTKLQAESAEFRDRQPGIRDEAKSLESRRDESLLESRGRRWQKGIIDYAGVAIQLGIALASVAALTRSHSAFSGALLAAIIGIGITAYALLAPLLHKP